MKFDLTLILLTLTALSTALPQSLDTAFQLSSPNPSSHDLFKRKGGGGSGSRGGSSSSSSSSGSTGSSGSSGSRPVGSTTSNTGGTTSGGSGAAPNYGGGRYYSGGAAVPYTSGGRSPLGVAPFLLPAVALGAFGGLWLYGAYAYPYSHPYRFYNQTANQNESKPVQCWCGRYSVCSCDDNTDQTYLDDLIGNGSTADLDDTVRVADVNGSSTILINGTLANGTTASSWGIKNANAVADLVGYWVMAATVAATVMLV